MPPTAVPRTPTSRPRPTATAPQATPTTPSAVGTDDKLRRALQKARDEAAQQKAEVDGLENALVLRAIESNTSSIEHMTFQVDALREAQNSAQRLQAEVQSLHEAAAAVATQHDGEMQRLLAAQATQLRNEAVGTAEHAVEAVRTQIEERLFHQTSAAERATIELEEAKVRSA